MLHPELEYIPKRLEQKIEIPESYFGISFDDVEIEIYNKVRFNYDLSGPQGAFIRFFKNDRQLGSGILYHGQHQSHLDAIDEELFISNLPVFLTNK